MGMFRIAILAGSALAALGAGARADDLGALKDQIEALDRRIAAFEAVPATPAGFRLMSITQGALEDVPGAPLSARARAAYGETATVVSVLPVADAPAGASIAWSGYARAGVVHEGESSDTLDKAYVQQDGQWIRDPSQDQKSSSTSDGIDIGVRGQLLVKAKSGTSVGEVGVKLELRADGNGNSPKDLYGKKVWGYWKLTDRLTLGGGYEQSVGDIVYGYDGACTCYYTDNADVDFDPGDTTQMRLSYASGPMKLDVAVESSAVADYNGPLQKDVFNDGLIGVAGDLSYAGKRFKGEIAGVWRDSNERETASSQIWQLGIGGEVKFGDRGFLSLAAAAGEGPYEVQTNGTIISGLGYNNLWWGVSALGSLDITDKTHVELAGGFKNRRGDQAMFDGYDMSNVNYVTYAVQGGVYHTPVKQLTIGAEAEWYTTASTGSAVKDSVRYEAQVDTDTLWADVVAIWRF